MITKEELSIIQSKAPLMSEGLLSPYQVSNMSKRQHKEWLNNIQLRYKAENEFKEQNKTPEEKAQENREEELNKINSRITQINAQMNLLKDFPKVKSKRMNQTKRTFLNYQEELNILIQMKGGLKK